MAQFSKNERLVSSLLSSSPRIKEFVKKIYVGINFIIHRRSYKFRIIFNQIKQIYLIKPSTIGEETFFGYYDKSPENREGWLIFNETKYATSKKPSSNYPIRINVININSGTFFPFSDSFAYNWQQGSRTQWIDNDKFIYNFFDQGSTLYKSAVFSLKRKSIVRVYDVPVQDSYKNQYFLSINYSRIMRLRPDYGYRNLPIPDDTEIRNLKNDGIWRVDFNTGNQDLIVSLQDVVNLEPLPSFQSSFHKLNHVMISPNGKRFIFIHRWYQKGRRFDRLVLFDNGNMNVLADDGMVSHMCWINDSMLFGYLIYQNESGFFFIDLNTSNIQACDDLNSLNNGDGHPACYKNWLVIDSYPDKSRMQHLTLYNYKTNVIYPLLEVFQPLKYQGESRCDLHPRFSPDGCRIYFDTVYTGERRLAYIDISSIINL